MKFDVGIDLSFFSSSKPFHLCPELYCISSRFNHECKQFGIGFFSEFTGTDHIAINSGELSSFSNQIKFISYQSPSGYMYLNKISSRTDINNMQNTVQHHLYIITDSVFVSVDFSTSDYNNRVKIQVSTQNKTQVIELETDIWVVLLKVGFIPLKGEITLIDGIFQKIDVKIGRIRLWTGKELDSSGYTLLNRLFLALEPEYQNLELGSYLTKVYSSSLLIMKMRGSCTNKC